MQLQMVGVTAMQFLQITFVVCMAAVVACRLVVKSCRVYQALADVDKSTSLLLQMAETTILMGHVVRWYCWQAPLGHIDVGREPSGLGFPLFCIVSLLLCVIRPAVPLGRCIAPRQHEAAPSPRAGERRVAHPSCCKDPERGAGPYLLIESFVVFKERLQGFEDLHFAGDPCWGLRLSLHHCHSQAAFMSGHQALQVLQQELHTRQSVA